MSDDYNLDDLIGEFDDQETEDESDEQEVSAEQRRPWDDWFEAGEPVHPPPMEWQPDIINGCRKSVHCRIWDENRQGFFQLDKVLLTQPLEICQEAYYPVPNKPKIKTIMGHMTICSVLRRIMPDAIHQQDDDDALLFEITQEFVAVKVNLKARMESQRYTEDAMKEIRAMQLIGYSQAQHVLGCRKVIDDKASNTLNVVMRYCERGDILDLIRQTTTMQIQGGIGTGAITRGLPEANARYWISHIVNGLHELRSLGICHCDLSPENIMMDEQEKCLVIDLGQCLRVPYVEEHQHQGQAGMDPMQIVSGILTNRNNRLSDAWSKQLTRPQGCRGKLPYMAPEIYVMSAFDGATADVWSLGTILFLMLTGLGSCDRPTVGDLKFLQMTTNMRGLLASLNVPISEVGLDLLCGMIEVNPRLRLTLDEVCRHQWFQIPLP